jgi:serine/threonine protein phosphatase PrpC
MEPKLVCKDLTDLALQKRTMDNITVLLVRLTEEQKEPASGEESTVLKNIALQEEKSSSPELSSTDK